VLFQPHNFQVNVLLDMAQHRVIIMPSSRKFKNSFQFGIEQFLFQTPEVIKMLLRPVGYLAVVTGRKTPDTGLVLAVKFSDHFFGYPLCTASSVSLACPA